MITTLTTLALAAAPFAPLQEDPADAVRIGRQQIDTARIEARMESKLGFTIYDPKSVSAGDLLRYAEQLTDKNVDFFFEDPATGKFELERRRRFIIMDDVIGVQDFDAGRDAALQVLADLDARLGAVRQERRSVPAEKEMDQVRTLRMRALGLDTAAILIGNVAPNVSVSTVEETGTIVLQGKASDVARAETLLRQVDEPLPQVTLYADLIEVVPTEKQGDVDPADRMDGNDPVVKSLLQLHPNGLVRRAGSLLIRGSAGGDSRFEVSTTLSGMSQDDEKAPARVVWSGTARGFDPETRMLSLDDCSMLLELPTFSTTANGRTTQTQFAGYRSEGMVANLALRADETTVVGSLGGRQIYISLRYTIAE